MDKNKALITKEVNYTKEKNKKLSKERKSKIDKILKNGRKYTTKG